MQENIACIPSNYKNKLGEGKIYPWRTCEKVGDFFNIRRTKKKIQRAAQKFRNDNKEFKFSVEQMDGYCKVTRVEC